VCLALGLISYYLLYPNLDSDILWSVAIGKWISLNQTVPVVDSFSWTIYGKEWLTHEWLFSLMAYKMQIMFGDWGYYLLASLPMVVTIYVLYLICESLDIYNSYAYIIPLTVGTSLLYKLALPFRAYIFGLMFFALLIYLLYFVKQNRKVWLYLFLLFILWANFHVSVCMGILILVVEMTRRTIITGRLLYPMGISLSSFAATLINPYGYKIWSYFLFTLTGMGESKSIAEWQGANFNDSQTLFVYLLLAATVIILHFHDMKINLSRSFSDTNNLGENKIDDMKAKVGWHKIYGLIREMVNKISPKICLLVLFWAFYIYALYSERMLFYAIILWIIVICIFAGNLENLNFTKRTYYLFGGLFLLWFFSNIAACHLKAPNIIDYDKNISPVEEVQFLKENPNYQKNLFNEYLFGGYLIINDIPVFIDARSDSYIKFGIQQKYGDIVLFKEDPQKVFEEMKVVNILIPNYSVLDRYLAVNQNWTLIHRGPSACIYTRVIRTN